MQSRPLQLVRANRLLLIGMVLCGTIYMLRTILYHSPLELPDKIQDLLTLATSVLIESLPFVVLGILLSIVIQIWMPPALVTKIIPENPYMRRLVISLTGILLPVCECGNVPLARGLLARGLSVSDSITFLLAAPILNPITLITTYQAFPNDPHIVIVRALGALLIANLVGWIISKHSNPVSLLRPSFVRSCEQEDTVASHKNIGTSVQIFKREATAIMPALIIGACLAGSIQVLVPRDVLIAVGSNPAWSILIMIALAGIISICSNVDAFFALAFSNTFTTGSIISFLVFGPMIDIKMLALMRTTYTSTLLWHVSILVALLSICIGLVVQYVF